MGGADRFVDNVTDVLLHGSRDHGVHVLTIVVTFLKMNPRECSELIHW